MSTRPVRPHPGSYPAAILVVPGTLLTLVLIFGAPWQVATPLSVAGALAFAAYVAFTPMTGTGRRIRRS